MWDQLYRWNYNTITYLPRHILGEMFFMEGELFLLLHFAFNSSGRRFDVDNRIKPVKDFLTGRFWQDDSQVVGEIATSCMAADMVWQPWMPPCLRMGNTDSVVPHVYAEVLPVEQLTGLDMGNWLSCKRR